MPPRGKRRPGRTGKGPCSRSCGRPAKVRGLCSTCYHSLLRKGKIKVRCKDAPAGPTMRDIRARQDEQWRNNRRIARDKLRQEEEDRTVVRRIDPRTLRIARSLDLSNLI